MLYRLDTTNWINLLNKALNCKIKTKIETCISRGFKNKEFNSIKQTFIKRHVYYLFYYKNLDKNVYDFLITKIELIKNILIQRFVIFQIIIEK